ncbi:MAG: potassium transporter [Rhodobacterales bacterium]|nr:MAG: potassium transporter [Rhodobacterales bacterium]
MQSFLFQATIYLGAAVIAVPLSARLGLGSVLGYLLAGVAVGFIPAIGSHAHELQHFAEFGVVVMLFLIGLELEPRSLWDMRDRLIGLGGLQIALTTLLLFLTVMALEQPWQAALAIGMTLALSSTAIVLQTITEKGLVRTAGGRSVFSVLLTQDIAVIPFLALLPLLAAPAPITLNADGSMARAADDISHGLSLTEGLPGWSVTLITLGAVAAVILAGRHLTRPVFRYISHAKLPELYTALALLMVVSIAVLMELVGLSPALGTFLAGVVLAGSEFRHQLENDLAPFKGLLLGLFFITVGAGIDFAVLTADPFRIIAMTLLLIAVKALVLYGLAWAFPHSRRDRRLFTLSLAQAGEFGFVMASFSLAQGVITPKTAQTLLLIIALSMMATPLLFLLFDWLDRRSEAQTPTEHDEIDDQGAVIVAGIGRFGQVVNRVVRHAGFRTVVIDNNFAAIQTIRRFGGKAYFGDPSRPDTLKSAGIDTAKVLVVALGERDLVVNVVRYARRLRPDLSIIARAHDRAHVYEIYQAGADHIVRELFDSSLRAGRYALEDLGLTEYEAAQVEQTYYHHDRYMVKELATLWKPGVAVSMVPEYVARARELDSELETALMEVLDHAAPRGPGADPEDVGFQSKGPGITG